MKRNLHLLLAVLLSISAMSLSAETTIVSVVSNTESGIAEANYVATLSDGTILGFQTDYDAAYFCGAISALASLSVPDSIRYESSGRKTTLPVTTIGSKRGGFYDGYNYSYKYNLDLEQAPNITSLTLPASISSISALSSQIKILHINGELTTVQNNDIWANLERILVPSNLLDYYYSQEKDWYKYILINVEGTDPLKLTINMTKAGEFAQLLLQQTDNWYKVNELTVVGMLNEDDLNVFKRMRQLTRLDLSNAIIEDIPNDFSLEDYMGFGLLQELILPEINNIGNYAFYNCPRLTKITMPKVTSIGTSAFYACGMTEISIPEGVASIADGAFSCSKIQKIIIPSSINTISRSCFYQCKSLTSVTLPSSITTIESWAFAETPLTSIDLPKVQTIDQSAFYNCQQLKSLSLGEGLRAIGNSAFSNCSLLTEVKLPGTIKDVSYSVFSGCSNIKKVTCHAVLPPNQKDGFMLSGCDMTNVKLYVPAISIDKYRASDGWKNFYTILAQPDKVKDLFIDDEVIISDVSGIASDCSLNLDWKWDQTSYYDSSYKIGCLDYNGDAVFQMYEYQQNYNLGNSGWSSMSYYQDAHLTSLIVNGPMNADVVSTTLECPSSDMWYFISLPYDTKVSDITYSKDCRFVIRKYSGANRALLTGDTWQNLTSDDIIHAYEGYILRCSENEVSFRFPAADNKNNVFAKDDVTIPLNEYIGEFDHNRSWNLIGNPYPCYFDSRKMEFTAPFMVWNSYNNRYDAYSPVDDDYILRPTQAFFVQRPIDQASITFHKDGRQKDDVAQSSSEDGKPRKVASFQHREVLNFSMLHNQHEDHTRIVLNEEASTNYELGKDAPKFIDGENGSMLFYTIDNGLKFAINERSIDDGIAQLGFFAEEEGEYTISLKSSAVPVMLIDHEQQIETSMNEDYTFNARQGFSDNRFTLILGEATGIEQIEIAKQSIQMDNGMLVTNIPCTINSLDGRLVSKSKAGECIHLPKGIYIVSGKDVKRKIVVK